MRRLILAILFLIFLFSSFGFMSWSIIRIKLKELKYFVIKDQLLNLRLSSEVLRDKFKQLLLYKENYKKELEISLKDSNIMNSESKLEIKLDNWDYSGLYIVNGVRRLSFKPPLTFVEDKELLVKLQYAFYFERLHKYPKAARKYRELEAIFEESKSEELGFILLHEGFCLALMEETEKALKRLEETEERFPGTHYATSARVLIELLRQGKRKKAEIKKEALSPEQKIVQLYNNGFYKDALAELKKLKPSQITRPLAYIRGRSFEETGQIPVAIKEYLELVVQTEHPDVAKKANRRLVMISNIYQKNKKLADYSKNKAEELGDEDMVKTVETTKKQLVPIKVLKEIKKIAKNDEELQKELEDDQVVDDGSVDESVDEIIEEKVEEAKLKEYIIDLNSFKMKIILADDRSIEGNTMNYNASMVSVKAGNFKINVKEYMISEISVFRDVNQKAPPRTNPFMTIIFKNGDKKRATRLKIKDDSIIILGEENETPYPTNTIESIVAGQG